MSTRTAAARKRWRARKRAKFAKVREIARKINPYVEHLVHYAGGNVYECRLCGLKQPRELWYDQSRTPSCTERA